MEVYFVPLVLFIHRNSFYFLVGKITASPIMLIIAAENLFPGRFSMCMYFPILSFHRCHVQNYQYIIFTMFSFSSVYHYTFIPMIQINPFKSLRIKLVLIKRWLRCI